MTRVLFYEKPGCRNNTRQKELLLASGHDVVAKSLLTEPWTAESLRPFFGDKPVAEWFNRASPKVKEGIVVPETFDEASAIQAMLAEPLLIRRPLMEADGRKAVGFDAGAVDAWIGLSADGKPVRETCPRIDGGACDDGHSH
ncbi:MAG TPA: ArsC/Spx/MgsR family protein [Candidatus Sulfotelmatobacter sp.]|jgi:nitrogenase-associated protein|nr:ArsC/Spx/MgsR family protein [Candidatus Sulfotelmatobacter sp.]